MIPNRRKWIIRIVIAVIILLAIVGAILYFTTDIFRTKRGAFFRYFPQSIEAFKILGNTTQEYDNAKKTSVYTRKGKMYIEKSQNVADQNILGKLNMEIVTKSDKQNSKENAQIDIYENDNLLFEVSAIRNKNIYAAYSSEIANGYLGVRTVRTKRFSTKA